MRNKLVIAGTSWRSSEHRDISLRFGDCRVLRDKQAQAKVGANTQAIIDLGQRLKRQTKVGI